MTLQGLTIDDDRTRDMDDAIWVEKTASGWEVTVCIADVSREVMMNSPEDARARELTSTRYFATGNSPMLPRELSEGTLSLHASQKRGVVVLRMDLSPDGERLSIRLSLESLHSAWRLSYNEIPAILNTEADPRHRMIAHAFKLAQILLLRRRSQGALALYDLNNGWLTTEEGHIKTIKNTLETAGHIIVQELMILANKAIADWAIPRAVPILFRNHMAHSATPDRKELLAQLDQAIYVPLKDLSVLRERTHLLLDRAEYGDRAQGHYGLNLAAYTHFTSPIRRYADLINHRQIRARILNQTDPPYTQAQIAEIAAHINQVQKDARDAKSQYLKSRDEAHAERAIEERWVDSLDAKGFERATKLEARNHETPTPAFQEAFIRRVLEDRAPLIALTVVMTQAPVNAAWAPVHEAIIAYLRERPEHAMTLLAQAPQVTPTWPATEILMIATGEAHARTFHAEAKLALAVTWSATGTGRTKKLAEQRACCALLAAIVGQTLLFPSEAMPSASAPAPKAILPPDTTKDPVVALHEWTQRASQAAPTYTFEIAGPAHLPVVICRVVLGILSRTATGANKQAAKRAAAATLLAAFPGLGAP